ncbi:SH3 domain-containing protein [Metabacillus litoralis]|uniref:SH3 domain-containing protein n=1 Tax=Metabacillus litoralis TaxID=152268 RepID=UPI000EF592B3|nr:SH3 domain-containing protein [Metabacillus litoralis]
MSEWITNLFDSIMELIYKLYIVLMSLSAPFRMAVIILLLAIVLPYTIKLILWLFNHLTKYVIQFMEASSNKIGNMTTNRRKQGKNPLVGTGLIDWLFSIIEALGTKLRNGIIKGSQVKPKTKKNYKLISILCIVGLPIWGLFSPAGKLVVAWSDFENRLVSEHLQPLGYDPSTYKSFELASTSVKSALEGNGGETATATSSEEYYVSPNEDAKNGVYIREGPSIDSRDIHVLPYGDYALYLGEEQTDGEGRIWYKVQVNDSLTGWISSNVVDVYE